MKIVVSSVSQFENFGGPSLVGGLDEILHNVFPSAEAVALDHLIKQDVKLSDNKIITKAIPKKSTNRIKFLSNAITYRLFKITFFKKTKIFDQLVQSDVYIDAEGIKYSDKLTKGKDKITSKFFPGVDYLPLSAKILGLKVISYTKSYGPVYRDQTKTSLRFYGKYIYDFLFCREKESREVLTKLGISKDKTIATYDSGIMMTKKEFDISHITISKFILLSISFQVIRQWNNKTPYIEMIEHVINHIIKNYEYDIVLFPNEFKKGSYDDLEVAKEIKALFKDNERVKIFDIREKSPQETKFLLSKSELLIGSRYHSVVASLSSGVPPLVIGWHYKYQEIMEAYAMSDFIVDNENCSKEWLTENTDKLLHANNHYRDIINEKNKIVKENILNAGMLLKNIIKK